MQWNKYDTQYLIDNYHNKSNYELSIELNIPYNSIRNKARLLSLSKSKEHKSKMISKRNVMVGRGLNFESVRDIAIKFKTKGEFKYNDPGAYSYASKNGYLEEITKHMIKQTYSIPQLICKCIFDKLTGLTCDYNNRKVIKPYELDIFYPELNLAIEYNGKGWHNDTDDNTNLKKHLCLDLNITLIIIEENNRNYEIDIKNQIIDNLIILNKILRSKLTDIDIQNIKVDSKIFDSLIDDDSISNIISKYTNYTEFRKKEPRIYQKLKKLGLLDKYTSHLKRSVRSGWTIEEARKVVNKYEYIYELVKYDLGCYLFIKRNKLNYLIQHLKYNWKR